MSCALLQPPRLLLHERWRRFSSFQLWRKRSNFEHDILTTYLSERSMVYRWMVLICQIPHPPFRISILVPSDWFKGPLQGRKELCAPLVLRDFSPQAYVWLPPRVNTSRA